MTLTTQIPPLKIARRSSAVSLVLRAIDREIISIQSHWPLTPSFNAMEGKVLVATTDEMRHRAWRLAYRVYSECGYVKPDPDGMIRTPYDSNENTFTLLVEDNTGKAIATVTLVFDSEMQLPCDEIFGTELTGLRAQGRKLVEVTRLAIDEAHCGSKQLLVVLFNFIFLFARRIRGFDDFVIEVNPRHVNYYRRLLMFEVAGEERPCPRVNGAPAVLLRIDLHWGEEEVRRGGGCRELAGERTLYPYFYPWKEDVEVSRFLAAQYRHGAARSSLRNGVL
jgi:hypothetical protein